MPGIREGLALSTHVCACVCVCVCVCAVYNRPAGNDQPARPTQNNNQGVRPNPTAGPRARPTRQAAAVGVKRGRQAARAESDEDYVVDESTSEDGPTESEDERPLVRKRQCARTEPTAVPVRRSERVPVPKQPWTPAAGGRRRR